MARWLLKSEPAAYGWADLIRDGETQWDGVRNAAAANNLRAMQVGDEVLIYHSGTQKAAVGIARVTRVAQPEGQDGCWASVHIAPVRPLASPVTLKAMKAAPSLSGMATIRQGRLSVSPVTDAQWTAIEALADG